MSSESRVVSHVQTQFVWIGALTPDERKAAEILVKAHGGHGKRARNLLRAVREASGWAVRWHGGIIAVAPTATLRQGIFYLEAACTAPGFEFMGINCVMTPAQICSAALGCPDGKAFSIAMRPVPDCNDWLIANGFIPVLNQIDDETGLPLYYFQTKFLPRSAAKILSCAIEGRFASSGSRGRLIIEIGEKGRATPFDLKYSAELERLAAGKLQIIDFQRVPAAIIYRGDVALDCPG